MTKKILFALHLAPPITGATIVNENIKNSKIINGGIKADYLNITTSKGLTNEKGNTLIVKVLNFLAVLKKLITIISKNKYDLCYLTLTAHGAGFYKDVILVFFIKLFRINLIYHFHNKGVKKGSKKVINRLLYKYAYKNAKFILLSPRLYYDISEFVKEKDVYYCPNGLSETVHSPIKRKKSKLVDGPCQLLFLSNMMLAKGVFILLEACKILKDRGLKFECHFVGAWSDITEYDFWKKCKALDIHEIVFAHGKRYGADKIDFFSKADIFVFPTLNEAFALVTLEAMQFSLPIVSTPEGGIPDIILNNETGFLVEQGNTMQLANKVEILINSPELRQKMGIKGRERYENLFTLTSYENRIKEIIHELLLSNNN